MKRPFLIALCFTLIFFLGGVAGWLLKPMPPVATSSSVVTSAVILAERLMQQLDASLHLTPAQENAIRPLCEEWADQAIAVGRRPHRRMELFEQYIPLLRGLLTNKQLPLFDKYIAEVRERQKQQSER